MRHFFFVLLVHFSLLGACFAVELAPKPNVAGPYVHLGDIFKDLRAPDQEKKRLFAAPPPGKKLVLSVPMLAKIAKAHKIAWTPSSALDNVTITQDCQFIGPEDIIQALHPVVAQHMPGESFNIELDQKDMKIYFPGRQLGDITVESLHLGRNRTTFSASVQKVENGQSSSRYQIQGKVIPLISLPALCRIVKQGEVIQVSDIHWIEVPAQCVQSQTLLQESDLIGATPRQGTLRESIPLKKSDIYRPLTIAKGEMVTLQVKTACLSMTTKGKAIENGLLGQDIKVLNLQSHRTIHATVIGPKLAEVDLASAQNLG